MAVKKLSSVAVAFVLGAATSYSYAAAPSVTGTSWSLQGRYKGKISVKCEKSRGFSGPFKSPVNLNAGITFNDDGTFGWTDNIMQGASTSATGNWAQTGAKEDLSFAHWYNSPMGSFAYALAAGLSSSYSQNGISAMADITPAKYTFSSVVNAKGTKLNVAESISFKIVGTGSYLNPRDGKTYSNTCNYNITFGRTFTGTPAQ